MPKPKFIEEIEKGRKKRIDKKKELDATSLLSKQDLEKRSSERIELSALARTETLAIDSNQVVPLLSEGTLWQDNWARAYIPRGEVSAMVNRLMSDFVGGFNIGHSEYIDDPARGWVGNWSKSDLTIQDIGDDRQAVSVSLAGLFEGMSVLNDLTVADRPLGLSIEITHDWGDFIDLGDSVVPVWKNLEIVGIAIVGSTGDPMNEDTIKLNKEDKMSLLDRKKKKEELDNQVDDTSEGDQTEETEEQKDQVEESDNLEGDATDDTTDQEEKLETAEDAIAEVEAEAKQEQENLAVEQLAKVKEYLATVTAQRDHYKAEFAKLKVHLSELAKSGIMVEKTSLTLKKDQEQTSSRRTELVYNELKN